MHEKYRKSVRPFLTFTLLVTLAALISIGCANRGGGPQGGPVDSIPPVLIKSHPAMNQTHVKDKKVTLEFNEIVILENAAQKIVVSPPQKTQTIAKAISHKVTVELPDSLLPNTTYTIDFSDAIADNNEKNKLSNFSISFSTGDAIDSLQMRGRIINAENLNPIANTTIGIHSNLEDSAFTTLPFDRITRSDENGHFVIRNIKAGTYRIYALQDIGNNNLYDISTEQIAFQDTLYVPEIKYSVRPDTIWKEITLGPDSLPLEKPERTIDSIHHQGIRWFEPRNILLKAFTNEKKRQYLARNERKTPYQISLFFNAPIDSLPQVKPINYESDFIISINALKDTLEFFLTDTNAIKNDTLISAITYQKTDSLGALAWNTDTIRSIFRPQTTKLKHRKNEVEPPKTEFLNVVSNISSKFNIYLPIIIKFATPTQLTSAGQVTLEQKIDTTWKILPNFNIEADSLGFSYSIKHQWIPEKSYRLSIDSAVFVDLYGKHNNKYVQQLTIRSLEEYSKLIINLPIYTGLEMIQLLNNKDQVMRTIPATSKNVTIEYLEPGEIFMRLFLDTNKNGKWDTGNYELKSQPEEVYYFPYPISLRAFWDIEEDWNYKETPLLDQKPDELLPQKNTK